MRTPRRKNNPNQEEKTKLHTANLATPTKTQGRSRELAMAAIAAALEKKALEPVLLDVSKQSSYTDFILIVSGRSDRHTQAIADSVVEELKLHHGARTLGVEGKRDGHWTLIDFGDVVVHVFYHPRREFYDLEGLWVDAPRVPLVVPPENRISGDELYTI
jgi:ribosome-associated protein